MICMRSFLSRIKNPPEHWEFLLLWEFRCFFEKKNHFSPFLSVYSSLAEFSIYQEHLLQPLTPHVSVMLTHFHSRKHFSFDLCILRNSPNFWTMTPQKYFVPIILIGSRMNKIETKKIKNMKVRNEIQFFHHILYLVLLQRPDVFWRCFLPIMCTSI